MFVNLINILVFIKFYLVFQFKTYTIEIHTVIILF